MSSTESKALNLTTTSTMNLAELTQHCQVHLFNWLHLTDLFHLRSLSRSLNESFLLHSRTRHTLQLKLGPGHEIPASHDTIICHYQLNDDLAHFLRDTFLTVYTLKLSTSKVRFTSVLDCRYICKLLDGWSGQLQQLHLNLNMQDTGFSRELTHRCIHRLVKRLNRQSELKYLSFKLNLYMQGFTFDLAVLARLEEFYFECPTSITDIYSSLVHYALPNARLQKITLWKINYNVNNDNERLLLFKLDADSARKFTALGNLYMTGPELALYAPKFTNLQFLSLNMGLAERYLPLDRVTALIATNLPKLATLLLRIDFWANRELDETAHLTPLPTLVCLQLHVTYITHDNIARYLKPLTTFPNLEKVKILELQRSHCHYCMEAEEDIRIVCRDNLTRQFYQCPKIVEVEIRSEE